MRGWKLITSLLIILGLVTAIFSESKIETPVDSSELVEQNNVKKLASSSHLAQTDSKLPHSTTNYFSITEISELSKRYIVQCKVPYAFMDYYSDESVQQMQDQIFETWSKSNEFKQQLAIALIHTNLKIFTLNGSASENSYAHTSLSQLVKIFPNSNLTHYFLVAHCIEQSNCDDSIFDAALAQDPYNGALWKLLAIQYATAGEVEQSLFAIQNSNTVVNYNSYWGETTHLFEQALATSIEMDELTRQISAIGFSSALALTNFKPVLEFCREHSATRTDIANACIEMGKRQFSSGNNLLEQHIGLAILKLVYDQQDNSVDARKIDSLHQEFRKATGRLATVPNLAMHDKSLNQYWWENILLYGETKALELTFIEAVRLSSDPDYNPCPNGKVEPKNAPE